MSRVCVYSQGYDAAVLVVSADPGLPRLSFLFVADWDAGFRCHQRLQTSGKPEEGGLYVHRNAHLHSACVHICILQNGMPL